jgi:hypothetical protein
VQPVTRRTRSVLAASVACVLGVVVVVALTSHASAAANADHAVGITRFVVGASRATATPVIRRAEIEPLRFAIGVELLSEHYGNTDTAEAVRIVLPAGLSYVGGAPAPHVRGVGSAQWGWSFSPASQGCTVAGRVATCAVAGVPSGTQTFGWVADVAASRPGSYSVRVQVTSGGANRPPRSLNDSATLVVLVGKRSGALAVSTPVLTRTPLRPSIVRAEVEVTQGGIAVRPAQVTCTATFAGDSRYQRRYPGIFVLGRARCSFAFNNARYLGKTLLGGVTIAAGGQRVTRTFSVRIGRGNALEKPVGATVDAGKAPKPAAADEWRGSVHLMVVDGTPGRPPSYDSVDVELTLLPGATKTDALGWTQPVSWVATYSSAWFRDSTCPTTPSEVIEQTVVRGRTGVRPGSNAKDFPRLGIRWDAPRSKWLLSLSFYGGGSGGMQLPATVKETKDCGRTWSSRKTSHGFGNYTVLADGTAASTALRGEGRPSTIANGLWGPSDRMVVTWNLALAKKN